MAVLFGLLPSPANAELNIIRHTAPVPCGVACPEWDWVETNRICNGPQLPGSYDQTTFGWVSDGRGAASLSLSSVIDWDMAVCTATTPSHFVSYGATIQTAPACTGPLTPTFPTGCVDRVTVTRAAVLETSHDETDQFFVRSFNWSDVASAILRYDGPIEVLDDTFEWR